MNPAKWLAEVLALNLDPALAAYLGVAGLAIGMFAAASAVAWITTRGEA